MNTEQIKTLVNGTSASSIAVTDRGLQFGDGVFETIRIHQGRPVWWQQHIDRLLEGCDRLHFENLPDIRRLQTEANDLIKGCNTGSLKIMITRGDSSSGYAAPDGCTPNRILVLSPGLRHESKAEQGIFLGVCEQQITGSKQLSGIKHLNRLEQVLARNECIKNGWDEGVMLDSQHRVIEGCMSNIFVWQKERLLTPQLENTGIRGVCRDRILSLAEEQGLTVEQCELDLGDLQHGDGMFVSNSLIGIWPVVEYKCQNFKQRQLEINASTRLLQKRLEEDICSAG
jgi:4-amino-4-deoxychorismate lyase